MKSKFLEDFKKFAMRGNVVDMAVGIIIGGAFGKIVSSLVADVIMPPIGLLIGGVNFTDLKITLEKAVLSPGGEVVKPAVSINLRQLSANHVGLSDYLVLDLPADPPVEQIAGEKERGNARTGSSPRRRAVADRDPRSA